MEARVRGSRLRPLCDLRGVGVKLFGQLIVVVFRNGVVMGDLQGSIAYCYLRRANPVAASRCNKGQEMRMM